MNDLYEDLFLSVLFTFGLSCPGDLGFLTCPNVGAVFLRVLATAGTSVHTIYGGNVDIPVPLNFNKLAFNLASEIRKHSIKTKC